VGGNTWLEGSDDIAATARQLRFTVAWSDIFRDRFEGHPLKGIALSFGPHTVRGEAAITRTGIEGGAIYALSADLREAIADKGQATLLVALRPDSENHDMIRRLSMPRGQTIIFKLAAQSGPSFLRLASGCLQEAAIASGVPLPSLSPVGSRRTNQRVAGPVNGVAPDRTRDLDRGGISFSEIDADYMIRRACRHIRRRRDADWEAPDRRLSAAGLVATGRRREGCA